tara:strand:+ start:240 stop:542 length:303 start_codon:yes stop_codon:yes gene_type:complete
MTIQNCLFNALLSRCEADINDCVARLTIYFNNSVGIGEHPQITEEMNKMLEELSSAEDRKCALLKHFSHYPYTKLPGKDTNFTYNEPEIQPMNNTIVETI